MLISGVRLAARRGWPAAAALLLVTCTATTSAAQQPTPPARSAASLTVGKDAWVAVSVAPLWTTPQSPRRVDRPALARPARIREWLAGMTLDQRRALYHRADTEALLGERVRVLRLRNGWAKVAVPDQPSPKDRRGYPGWLPTRQLTTRQPARSGKLVTVTRRTTWLRTDDPAATRVFEISFGTTLAYVGSVGRQVQVRTPLGVVRRIRAGAVSVHRRSDPALPPTRADVLRAAQAFTGLPYLWGGLSGFGLDCSGLTWLDYRVHGLRIPRDAAPQSRHGRPLRFADLRRGDLLFYATNGLVHHVTMYAGHHQMVQAPHTGGVVETGPVARTGYAGARRYLP